MTATYPTNPVVEMLIGSSWTDITGDCRLSSADSGGGITITRGVPNEGASAEPTQVNLTLNNGVSKAPASAGRTGVYSPMNPSGPWFGQLGRNQHIRVGVDRQIDTFSRTLTNEVGSTPDRVVNGDTIPGERWHITGPAADITMDGNNLIFAANGSGTTRFVSFGNFGDCDIKTRMQVSARDTEMGIQARMARSDIPAPVGTTQTFDDGIAGWTGVNGTVAQDTTIKHTGVGSCVLTVTGAPPTASAATVISQTTMWGGPSWTNNKIIPNSTYRLRFWARSSIAGTLRHNYSWYNEDGVTFLGSSTQDVAVAANTWVLLDYTAVAPQDAGLIRPAVTIIGNPPAGTQVWIDQVEVSAVSNLQWYSANFVPGATDQIKFGKVSPGTSRSAITNLGQQLVVNTWYWMRVQMSGQRMRMKMWKDGDTEPSAWPWRYFDDQTVNEYPVPQVGEIGLFAGPGTGIVKFDSFQVDIWRGHAEISELPTRWDLSRQDRWVPVQARGILRRLGQGRKDLKSAVSLHLNSYMSLSKGWWALEEDTGESVGNNIQGGAPGAIQGLTFGTPDLTGTFRLPGVSGYAELAADTASFSANAIPHTGSGKETYLWFMRLPNLPTAETTLCTISSTGTVRTWKLSVTAAGALHMLGSDRSGAVVADSTALAWNGNSDLPTGCWLACTLLLTQNGTGVDWAVNHHRPGSDSFWTLNNTVASSTVGTLTGISFKGNSVLTAAGNLQFTQVMHYAGDLPFVTYDFERAAVAYESELATSRFARLCGNAGINSTTIGYSGTSTPMGYQLPAKLVNLLEDCAQVENGIVVESRDDFELCLVTRDSLWNRYTHALDIDKGHLSEPLEPNNDDQQTRNDVTVTRTSGGSGRSIQTSGPLNINPPEQDPNGVGTYDEQIDINFYTAAQCQSLADWRRGRGTLPEPRYPSMHADLTATAYRLSPPLAAAVLSVDAGDSILLTNPEADYAPREQFVSSYTETIDQMDWDLVFTTLPGTVYRVGVMNYTTRVDSLGNFTQAAFVAGTDTKLKSTLTGAGNAWVKITDSEASFPFEVEVGGVRLLVVMTGDILNSNPHFEDGTTTGWAATSANVTIAVDRYDPKRGSYSCRVTSVAAGTDGAIQTAAAQSDVSPAVDYLVSGWIKAEVAATDLRLAVDWYQSNGTTNISTSLPTPITTLANTWTFYSAVVTSPALAEWGRLKARNVFAGASRMWVDDLRIMPVSSYAADPQTLTVVRQPTNNQIRTIPTGTQIRLAQPWRPAW